MLATLNLQLTPVEPLADTNLKPATALPGDTVALESGFAQLLSLRVDAGQVSEDAGGELLPEGGSGLPLSAAAATEDLLPGSPPTPVIGVQLIKLAPGTSTQGAGAMQSDTLELVLETPVTYAPPVSQDAAGAELPNPVSPVPVPPVPAAVPLATRPAEVAGRPKPVTDGWQNPVTKPAPRPDPVPGVGHARPAPAPAIDTQETLARIPAREFTMPPASLGLRERSQPVEPVTRAASIAVADTAADLQQRVPLADFGRRLELTPLQRADGRVESGTDLLPARIAVPQAAQTLQAQISPQPSLPPAPSAVVSFAAPAQPTADLIGTSVRESAWGEQIGERVVMMAGNQLKQAEIRLTPAELGPLRVQVSVDDGAAHVTFHAQHAVTREALEQALPRLREMLAENGLSLGQADVSDRGVGEGNREHESDGGLSRPANEDSADAGIDIAQGPAQRLNTSNGLVDTFA